jgi:hypothetical protein
MRRLFNTVSVIAILLGLNGCGGGASVATASNQSGGTYIAGMVSLFSSKYTPQVRVTHTDFGGATITDAVVTVNGQALVYNSITGWYEGTAASPDAAGKFNLSVTVNGSSYTASTNAFTSVPVVTFPSTFNAASANTISWTPPGGAVGTMYYSPEIFPYSAGSTSVYSGSTNSTSVIIPAGTTTAGVTYGMVLGSSQVGVLIANAASGSSFGVTAQPPQINFTAQ